MDIQYKIIKKDPANRQIVVRFFTTALTELTLAAELDANGAPLDLVDGVPVRCRTDYTVTFPLRVLTPAEETEIIMFNCPWKWLEDEERMLLAKTTADPVVTSITDSIANLTTAVGVLAFEGTPATTPASLKAAVWEKIKRERQRREDSGYLVGSVWYHSDAPSLMKYNTILGMAAEAGYPADTVVSTAWKNMAGTFATMTVATLRNIRAVGVAKVTAIYTVAEFHRAAMEASANPAAYDFSGGWPAVYIP